MSNKVRIYELSKELKELNLDLENKDILAICDRLNITYKNHSSTITEAQAESIRNAARAGVAGGGLVRPSSKPRQPSPSPAKAKVSKPKEVNRPQILEVRRHKPKPPVDRASNVSAGEVAPPQSPQPAAGQGTSPAPARPTAPAPVKPSPAGVERPAAASRPPSQTDGASILAGPSPREVEHPPSLVKKPVIRRSQQTPESPAAREVSPPASWSNGAGDKETAAAPILLKKPSQPRRPRPGDVSDPLESRRDEQPSIQSDSPEDGTVLLGDGEEMTLKLKRPSFSRPKRTKPEVEDDEMDLLNKPKSGTKQKRRTVKDEEEDIFEGDLTAQTTVVDVSQSLVRPPKQKTQKQSRPTAATTSRPSAPSRGGSRRQSRSRDRHAQESQQERPTLITLASPLTVQELAKQLMVPETEVIKLLFLKGLAANINQTLDIPTATMVAQELEVDVETIEAESEARKVTEMLDVADLENLHRRPPVVTIMGHVDHGKTTLLDSIRKTKVAQGEAGGITQHIGAYHVDLEHNGEMQQVVFLDTPGHEAFTAMRARGARVTDIAILVVAADDGVRPQTIEAISHAQAAKVPIIVAVNKMDKESAQPDRVKQELTEYGLVPEEWGGEAIIVPVSALKGENLDTLLEMVLLVSEVEDLQANPDRLAKGTVIEANLDKARGPVATLLVQNGTLRVGDVLVVGSVFGKVRAMIDDRGHRVEEALPSFAVEVLGLNDVPAAGDEFDVMEDEKSARQVAEKRADEQRHTRLQQAMASRRISLGSLSDQAREGELKELNLLLKADVQGSVEAILASLGQLPQNEVQVRVLLSAPGEVTETDVDLAAASNAVIVGFNTSLASGARQAADEAGVDIREYNIIYKLLEDIQAAMEGLLDPELVSEPLGQTEVRAVFPVGRGAVAGCYVQSGKLVRNCRIRVLRAGEVVFEGVLDSLKRMKDDVKEVNAGYECGIGVDNFNDWKEGDIIESYQLVTKRRTLSMD